MSSLSGSEKHIERLNHLIDTCIETKDTISFSQWQEIYSITKTLNTNGREKCVVLIFNKYYENLYLHPFRDIDRIFKILSPLVLYHNYNNNNEIQLMEHKAEITRYKAARCVNILEVLNHNLVNDVTKYICEILSDL